METGICIWSSIAVRAEDRHSAEMVTQLLFGETYTIIDQNAEWISIRTTDCNYQGWISRKQHTPISDEAFNAYQQCERYHVRDTFLYVRDKVTHIAFPVFLSAQFPMPINGAFSLANHTYTVELPQPSTPQHHEGLTEQQDQLLDTAFKFLNAPYLWGGRTLAGIDCSGFVQAVFKSIGIQLPRDASQQVAVGDVIDFAEEARIGDVAFFENEEGRIVHTGIVCGHQQIIHASGHVQINTLDDTGIYNHELKHYTHQLRVIKRIL